LDKEHKTKLQLKLLQQS